MHAKIYAHKKRTAPLSRPSFFAFSCLNSGLVPGLPSGTCGRVPGHFRKYGLFLRDSADRALSFAGTAVDAGICVDDIVFVTLRDSFYGALSCTGTAADARIGNNTCHYKFLLKKE
jgi:hypothetical protein